MARGRWLTGDISAPTEYICRRVRIPADFDLVIAVNGALLELTKAHNWEQFGAATPEQVAALMSVMFDEYFEDTACMIGAIMPYATAIAPAGTLPCDGSIYAREDYPLLYALLDAVYILDADTFQTPDLRGRAVIGTGAGDGLTGRVMGDSGGAETHQLTVGEMPHHTHKLYQLIDLKRLGLNELAEMLFPAVTPNPLITTDGTGGDEAHNNMQPFHALNYCIVAR